MFTSDARLCLTVGCTVVKRGERLLRRHFGEVAKPSKGRGCLRTDLEGTPDYISSDQGGFLVLSKLYHGCRSYHFC